MSKQATEKESLEVIKSLIKKRLSAKGMFQYNDKWLNDLAAEVLSKSSEPIKKLPNEPDI
jgi:hypothetical protein